MQAKATLERQSENFCSFRTIFRNIRANIEMDARQRIAQTWRGTCTSNGASKQPAFREWFSQFEALKLRRIKINKFGERERERIRRRLILLSKLIKLINFSINCLRLEDARFSEPFHFQGTKRSEGYEVRFESGYLKCLASHRQIVGPMKNVWLIQIHFQ